MYDNFKYLLSKIPYILQATEVNRVFIKSWADMFDVIDTYIDLIEKMWLIDYATGEFLDDLGTLVDVPRMNEADVNYRLRIKLAFQSLDIVPTLNNVMELIKEFTGYFPEIREGWNVDGEPARYDIDFVAPKDFDFNLFDNIDLEKIVGAGVKINSQSCIESYTETFYSGDFYAGDTMFMMFKERTPICGFSYKNTIFSGDNYANDEEYFNTDKFLGGKYGIQKSNR